jgi:hypothetical protein
VMCASMKTAYVVTRSWSSQVTFTRLLAHYTRLFPGAPPPLITEGGSQQIREQKLYEVLSQPGLPDEISTKWLGQQMLIPWRDVSKHLMPLDRVQRAIAGLGWSYVARPGRAEGVLQEGPCSGR